MTLNSVNNIDIENELKNLLKFDNDEEKLDFEIDVINLKLISEIKKLMDKHDINKTELAEKLGTSKSYITQLFSGDKILNLKFLAKLQRIFNVQFKGYFDDIHQYNNFEIFEIKEIGDWKPIENLFIESDSNAYATWFEEVINSKNKISINTNNTQNKIVWMNNFKACS
jgi:transcriptional regulator with XRE-family HTH domain